MKIGIIGAGPAGLTTAYKLSQAGIEVDVYEASSSVGGLSKSIDLWNQRVDLGPHRFFSTDRKVNELWLEIVGNNYTMVERLTRIYYNKKFFNYPLNISNTLYNLGPFEAAKCLTSYLGEKVVPTNQDGSFEDWVVHQFGRHLFSIFFKSYSEKLWGISCKELDADFASQRIKKLSLSEAVKNAIFPGQGNKHKTLVDRFAYPDSGSGFVYEQMARKIIDMGSSLYLEKPVHLVNPRTSGGIELQLSNGEIKPYDHIVSSMPLTLLVKRLPGTPPDIIAHADALRFRNTILVYLKVKKSDLFPDNWIYIHDPTLLLGRVTNFRNWSPTLFGSEEATILALEYWSYSHDKMWNMTDSELIKLGSKEIKQTGLLKDAIIEDGKVIRINRCYPVYDKGYKEHLKPIEMYLNTIEKLTAIGRYGAFKYNNQDHSILMGILASEKIAHNSDHSLWEINTNYETYQESALISDTGLVKAP